MPATRTATASARCTSIRWRVSGHCSAPGCVRIAASRRRSCQSISASLSSCTTRAGAEKPCSVPLSLLWSGDALHHPGSRQEPPMIIEPADLARLETALALAQERRLVLADMMTGRHNALVRLLQALRSDPEVYGDPVPGTRDDPGILLSGVHYLRKVVAGLPNPRPAWYFNITEQGEGLADTGVHLVDRVHETLFPGQALDWQQDIDILGASRWPTLVSLAQFHDLTGESG